MPVIRIETTSHSQMVNITSEINALVPSDMKNGLCCVFSKHTTAGIMINENADPDVCSDILDFLDKTVPWNYAHFRHFEGNSAAHIKSALTGFSQTVPVEDGRLALGTWQGVYLCEFDGPRERTVQITFSK